MTQNIMCAFREAIFKLRAALFRPPYPWLPWLIWFYIALCALIQPHSSVNVERLLGFDDHVRMTQVLDWINGAGWYDRTITRVNAPEGFTTIWSRIVDIPIAAVVLAAQQFVPQKTAAIIAAAVVPMAEVAILFVVAPYFARPLIGKNKANLYLLFLLFTSVLNPKHFSLSGFAIGEASHHPWYIILNLALFGAAARLAAGGRRLSPLLIMGFSAALLTAVGIEGYPMIAGAAAILALAAWGRNCASVAAQGGKALLCGALGSLVLLPMHQPFARFFTVSFAEPSILGPILVAAAAAFLAIEQGLLRLFPGDRKKSAILSVLVAAAMAGALVYAFPAALHGGAAGLSPAERDMALHNHEEAKSIYAVSKNLVEFIGLVVPVLIALAAGFYAFLRAKGRRRALFFCYLGFAVVGGGMSGIFSRYYHHAMTASCAWLLWAWEGIKNRLRRDSMYGLYVLGSFVALGPWWMLLLPSIAIDAPFASYVLSFPAATGYIEMEGMCDSLPLSNYINAHYGKNTLLMVPYMLSARFVYETDVRIDFLDNYPSQDKFLDHFSFWYTRVPEIARLVAERHNFDLLAVCTAIPIYNKNLPYALQSFFYKLQIGDAPDWLKPVKISAALGNYRLYEVDKAAVKRQGPLF